MAQWFQANKRWETLAQELIDADSKNLGHIDLSEVIFLEMQEDKPKHTMVIKPIREPFDMLLNKRFYVGVNEALMGDLDDEHKELWMYRTLLHISVEPGKMNFPDVMEFSCIITNFGHDWHDKPIKSVLNMLNSGQAIAV